MFESNIIWPGTGVMLVILLVLVIGGVIAITQAQRKVPVQYAQRAVGRKMYSGGTSFMPLRVNFSGVMPIIFAQSILMFPQQIFLNARPMCLSGCRSCMTFSWDWRECSTPVRSLYLVDLFADDFVFRLFLGGDAVQ